MDKKVLHIVCIVLLFSSCISIGHYYTVLPQTSYRIPDSTALLKTTVCTSGIPPRFGNYMSTPRSRGVSSDLKTFHPPAGHTFYAMMIQLEKSKDEVVFDINKTYMITNTGYKAYPYYALPIIGGTASVENDLLKQESYDKPFLVRFPKGRTQKYVNIWYAIPLTDIPVAYEFYGSQCEVKKYEKK